MDTLYVTSAERSVWGCLKTATTAPSVRKLFLMLTRAHFAAADNFGTLKKELGELHWSDDPEVCNIKIDLQYEFLNGPIQDTIPRIGIGISGIKFSDTGASNYAGNSDDTSTEYFSTTATGTVQWACYGDTADLAGNLAETIFAFFTAIKPLLMNQTDFNYFRIQEMGPVTRVDNEGKKSCYRIDLGGSFQYNHVVALNTESHRLKKIVLESSADFATDNLTVTIK